MSCLIRSYKSKKDIFIRLQNETFTLPKNAIVVVRQIDERTNKVLIEFGPHCIDWFNESILNNFEFLGE